MRTQEEWGEVLEGLGRDLARLDAQVHAPLLHRFTEFEAMYKEVKAQWYTLRMYAQHIRRYQKKLRKRHKQIATSLNNLRKMMQYGKVLLAGDADVRALERAIKQRRTRLRVAKMRKRHRAAQAAQVAQATEATGG